MKPIKSKDLLELDKYLEVVKLQSYPIPEQVVWQAGKGDYSEVPIHNVEVPNSAKCGEWVVEQLLAVQARTHRIGTTWDVQSQRYTGKRVVKVAKKELDIEEVFYVRPVGFYTNRKGKKYEWTQEHRQRKLGRILSECEEYSDYYEQGMCEEHIRDYLPQAIRQNFVVSFNLRSVLHFMDLRSKLDAQLEIQALCESFVPELQKWTPSVWAYYEEKRLHKARLSP